MSTRLSSRGFTLIEVLVALAIVAIALAAAIRAVGLMTDGNGLLRDKSLALLAAESRLAELRLASARLRETAISNAPRAACGCTANNASRPPTTPRYCGWKSVCARSANRRCRWRA